MSAYGVMSVLGSADMQELSDPEGNYLFNLKRRNMKTLDTIEATDPQNGDKLLFRVNRKMSSTFSSQSQFQAVPRQWTDRWAIASHGVLSG